MAVDQAKIIFIFDVKAMALMREDLRWWSHINNGPHGDTRTRTILKNIWLFLPTYGSLDALVESILIPSKYCNKMCRRHPRTGSVVTAFFNISTLATIDASRRGLPAMTSIFFGRGNQINHSCRWRCGAMLIPGRYYIFKHLFFSSFTTSRTSFPSLHSVQELN